MSKPRYRGDIKNSDVLTELAKGKTVRAVSALFDCSEIVVQRIRKGLRVEHPSKKIRGKVCSCCKVRAVAKGNRFLCCDCFRSESSELCVQDELSCRAPGYRSVPSY